MSDLQESIFGYEVELKEEKDYNTIIKDGAIVKCMFLSHDFPGTYKTKITKRNNSELAQQEETGVKAKIESYSHKDGGMVWNLAVTASLVNGKWMPTFEMESGRLILPSSNIFLPYIQHTPDKIWDDGLGFSDVIKGGMKTMNKKFLLPRIGDLLPPTMSCKDWERNITADTLTAEDLNEPMNKELHDKEKARIASWNHVLGYWATTNEEGAINKLMSSISQRLMLFSYGQTKDSFIYNRPESGMIFEAKIAKRGRFSKLLAFEFNRNAREYVYYCKEIKEPTEQDRILAKLFIEAKKDRMVKYQEARKAKEKAAEIESEETDGEVLW